jgi:hypothetical protein
MGPALALKGDTGVMAWHLNLVLNECSGTDVRPPILLQSLSLAGMPVVKLHLKPVRSQS